jgi:hypothetical protein
MMRCLFLLASTIIYRIHGTALNHGFGLPGSISLQGNPMSILFGLPDGRFQNIFASYNKKKIATRVYLHVHIAAYTENVSAFYSPLITFYDLGEGRAIQCYLLRNRLLEIAAP